MTFRLGTAWKAGHCLYSDNESSLCQLSLTPSFASVPPRTCGRLRHSGLGECVCCDELVHSTEEGSCPGPVTMSHGLTRPRPRSLTSMCYPSPLLPGWRYSWVEGRALGSCALLSLPGAFLGVPRKWQEGEQSHTSVQGQHAGWRNVAR